MNLSYNAPIYFYSKDSLIRLQLIRMSDYLDRNMKNEKCSLTVEYIL
jgi:hypothetical protein